MVTQLKVNKYLKQKFENQKNLKKNISNAFLTPMKELSLIPYIFSQIKLFTSGQTRSTSGLRSSNCGDTTVISNRKKPLVPRASRNTSNASMLVGTKIDNDRSFNQTESRRLTRWNSRVEEIIEKLEDNQSRMQRRTTIVQPLLKEN